MKKALKSFVTLILIFVVISVIYSFYQVKIKEQPEEIGVEQFLQQIDDENIEQITIEDSKVNIELKTGELQYFHKEINDSLSGLLKNYNADIDKAKNIPTKVDTDSKFASALIGIIPYILFIGILGALLYFMLRQVQGANSKAMMFGQSGAREMDKNKKKVTFKDVAGSVESKEELKEIVAFLKKPQKFTALGAKIPKGVLLMGSPGTGKTLLAKAVAGEADVPFFSISGSEFVEMFVGVGASRVRDLFKKAKKNSPCIIFVDEIDAVGRQRGAGLGGSHDEREQTLNQILVELDGFDTNTNVIVLAATNRPDILDPALLRPGRFDRRVVIDLPDIKEREAILKVHSKNKPLEKDVELMTVAQRTPGFSGADLANLLNEAAILTAHQNKKVISQENILDSIEKVLLGPEKRSHIITDKEKKITAYHEAGHALISHLIPEAARVQKVSIIARGRAGGYTLSLPEEDRSLRNLTEFKAILATLLGGYETEKLVFGDITTGASSDLSKVTQLAKKLVTDYGMGEKFVPRTFGHKESMIFLGKDIAEHRNYSEKTAEKIDDAINKLIEDAAKITRKILSDNRDKLDKIANELLKKETIERDAFEELIGKKTKK